VSASKNKNSIEAALSHGKSHFLSLRYQQPIEYPQNGLWKQPILECACNVNSMISTTCSLDLDKHQRVLTKVDMQDTIAKGSLFRKRERGFAV
jgi:hypothetical protein